MALWKKAAAPVIEPAKEQAPAEPAKKKRKNKQDDSRRTRSSLLTVRLTPEEKAYIQKQAKAAGMNVTDYLVACSRQVPVVYIPGVPDLVLELRRQGTNLNQLAMMANTNKDTRALDLKAAAADARAAREEIREFCLGWDAQIRNAAAETEVTANGHPEGEPQQGDAD